MLNYDKIIEQNTGIFVFDNALSPQLCDEILKEYHKSKKKFKGLTSSGYNPRVKNTIDWEIDKTNIQSKLYKILNIALDKIFKRYPYLKDYPINWSGFQFQESKKGEGYFKPHIDSDIMNPNEQRILAPIFYLNDVEEGGETTFKYQDIKVKPKKGRLIIFPSTWRYYHQGIIPKSNDKYIITCFGIVLTKTPN